MPERTGQFALLPRCARAALIASFVFLALLIAGTIAVSLAVIPGIFQWTHLALLVLVVLAEILAGIWVFILCDVIRVVIANEAACHSSAGLLDRIETLLENQRESSKKLVELVSLSDQAKSLIYRDQEIEALRGTIREDMMRQDYRTAVALIDGIETKFGYADEAARLREELEQSKKATLDEKIDAAVARVQDIIDQRDWTLAMRESQRIIRLFPENPKVSGLPERIEAARTRHKRELLQAYGEAVRKNDVDRSIDLLKELDLYLTPQEGAALQESARGVFKAKLHNFGVRFAIAVTDQQWAEAVRTGEEVIREFPNSRMAAEVRQKLDILRARATEGADSAKA